MRFEDEVIEGGPSVLPGVHALLQQVSYPSLCLGKYLGLIVEYPADPRWRVRCLSWMDYRNFRFVHSLCFVHSYPMPAPHANPFDHSLEHLHPQSPRPVRYRPPPGRRCHLQRRLRRQAVSGPLPRGCEKVRHRPPKL
jgi:hypothetical protein